MSLTDPSSDEVVSAVEEGKLTFAANVDGEPYVTARLPGT